MSAATLYGRRMAAFTLACTLRATCPHAFAACDFSSADDAIRTVLATDGITNAGLVIGSSRGIFHKQYFGSYDDTTVVPIASSSKMLAGVRIMQLVDRGVLNLDKPVSEYLSGSLYPWSSTAAPITLRQMFSHTAGYGNDEDDPVLDDKTITLEQAVQEIAANDQGAVATGFPAGGFAVRVRRRVDADRW